MSCAEPAPGADGQARSHGIGEPPGELDDPDGDAPVLGDELGGPPELTVGAAVVAGEGSAEALAPGGGLADGPGGIVTAGGSVGVGAGDPDPSGETLEPLGSDPGSGVDPPIGPVGAELAVWAPGAGSASGRIAAPIAIAATSDGSNAAATRRVDRVWFMGVSP